MERRSTAAFVALHFMKLAWGQFHPFMWMILVENKEKGGKEENGKENKKQLFWLLFLLKQRLGKASLRQ
jgi:hypothetical protein